jgi:hypothetical protein
MTITNECSDYGHFYDTELDTYINYDQLYLNKYNNNISQTKYLSVQYNKQISTYISISIMSIFSLYTIIKGAYSYYQ